MVSASSSAVRVDAMPMFGSIGMPGGERKLKKKPVLVLAPEELAKAHHLFQLGAAEQMGEFDPMRRPVPTAPVFGLVGVPSARFDDDEEDDYQPPFALDDDEELPEEDLPPIDLDAVLAMSQAEQDAEDAFYAAEPVEELAEDAPVAAVETALDEPEAVSEDDTWLTSHSAQTFDLEEIAPEPDTAPAEALARILSRAAAIEVEAEPVEPVIETEVEVEFEAEADAEIEADIPVFEADTSEAPNIEANAQTQFAPLQTEPAPLDLIEFDEFADDQFAVPEPQQTIVPVFEAGPRSELRARLVREDLTLSRPELSFWRKIVITVRRMLRGNAAN